MNETPILIKNLTVHYRQKLALDGLSLEVRRGEIFGFIGPNGAGKTTTIKAILGLLPAPAGSVELNGYKPSDTRSRLKTGFLPEEATYYRFLTPAEILRFYGECCSVPGRLLKPRIAELLEMTGLTEVRNRQIRTLSKGTVQKIGLAQALINDPDTLVLDEPMSGLDPIARMNLRAVLAGLKARGKTIFFSSHELSEVELQCDSVAILVGGKTVRQGRLGQVLGEAGQKNLEKFFLETVKAANK